MARLSVRRPNLRRLAIGPLAQGSDWLMSALMLVALGLALGGFASILSGAIWWFAGIGVSLVVLLVPAIIRSLVHNRLWAMAGSFVSAVMFITLVFAPTHAILGVIPTFETFADFHLIEQDGLTSIAEQQIPAEAVTGILYLICLGLAVIAFAMDTFAFTLRTPALTGLPLLVLLLVPSFVIPTLADAFFFALTAFVWLSILMVRARPADRRTAVAIAGAAVIVALVLPAALPVSGRGTNPELSSIGGSAGLNPIITLGNDLRQGSAVLALTYTTSDGQGTYLRLTTLDDFSGVSWLPSNTDILPGHDVATIGPAPGLGPDVPVADVTTTVNVSNIQSRWLPVPYAAASITGLAGSWAWEPNGLAVRSELSNANGQGYVVQSVEAQPTIDQLRAAATTVLPGMEKYLTLPDDLPSVVGQTAKEVVGSAATYYDMAIALQAYFTGGTFTYSEEAPVKEGYDGSGASVLAAFLAAKSGYCVHFASAMASMARTLGIPSRVVVGFTPGSNVVGTGAEGENTSEYRVTTHDFHAWPELYFAGIGWVRFEPTPGHGAAPQFAQSTADDPTTPNVDESKPDPASSSAPAPAPSIAPDGPQDPNVASPNGINDTIQQSVSPAWYLLVLLIGLIAVPFILRTLRRNRRMRAVGDGSALDAWDEVRDTAVDLGIPLDEGHTPRQFAADLAAKLDDDGLAALSRLRKAMESQAFGDQGTQPDTDDVREVVRALRKSVGLPRAALGILAPRSLVAGWFPAVSTPE